MKIKLSEIFNRIQRTVRSPAIFGRTDDCVGSCIGLYLYIQQEFPDVQPTVYLEEICDSFKFLEGSDRIIHSCEEEKVYDLFIALDAGDKQRLGASAKYFDTANARSALTTISATQAMHRPIISKQRQVLPVN